MTRAAFQPNPNGYPTTIVTNSNSTAAMGNKKTSVELRNGNVRYPKCVMYQYQLNAAAYNAFATISGNKPSPSTIGIRKN